MALQPFMTLYDRFSLIRVPYLMGKTVEILGGTIMVYCMEHTIGTDTVSATNSERHADLTET